MMDDDERGDRGGNDGGHVAERLDAYRTGELDAETRRSVEAHLAACAGCREELASLVAWAAAIERGYEAHRTAVADLEPDWAAQRSAIVARTSARAGEARKRPPVGGWIPQIALVALAALIVGIVWHENPRERDLVEQATGVRSAEEAGERMDASDIAVEAERDQAAPPEAPPAATPGRTGARQTELAKQAVPEAEDGRAENQAALADRAAEASLAAPLSDLERFERQANAALRARDTAAARRALALWRDTVRVASDTLAAARIAGEPALLADSLERLLERPE